jgi:hypothetical protein
MAIENIPNQPIQFDPPIFDAQTCLNSDQKKYNVLLQDGDEMCIQVKNIPSVELITLDSSLNYTNEFENANFANSLNDWFQVDVGTGTNYGLFGSWSTSWYYYANGGATTYASKPANIGIGQFIDNPGNLYMISFEADITAGEIKVYLGDLSGVSWNYQVIDGSTPNIDGRYTCYLSAYAGNFLCFANVNNGAKINIKNVRVVGTWNAHFVPDSGMVDGWMYVESLNGWQCKDINQSLSTAFSLTSGQDYRLSFKVSNLTNGSITWYDVNDIPLISPTENRQYDLYFNSTTNDPVHLLTDNALAIGGVIYDMHFYEMCYNYKCVISQNGVAVSEEFDSGHATFPVQFYQDRLIWCFDIGQINNIDTGDPMASGCYDITILGGDCGDDDYTSWSVINYKATGSHPCSVWVEADNSGYAFDLFFKSDDTTVTYTIGQRLRLLQFNPIYPNKSETYLYSNGQMTRTYGQTGKKREAWFDYCDESTHDVIRVQLLSDTLTIEGANYFCLVEDYEPEWAVNGKQALAQSRVELMAVSEPTLFNKSC